MKRPSAGLLLTTTFLTTAFLTSGCDQPTPESKAQTPAQLATQGLCNTTLAPTISVENQIRECNAGHALVRLDATVHAECDLNPSLSFSIEDTAIDNPRDYALGEHLVTVTARDNQSQRTTAQYIAVSVRDTLPPVVLAGDDQIVECTSVEGTPVEIDRPSTTDACNPNDLQVFHNIPANHLFAPGTTPVTWSAVDSSGNHGSASHNITIKDTTAPFLDAGTDLVVEQQGDCAIDERPNTGTLVTVPTPNIWDACTPTTDLRLTNNRTHSAETTFCLPNAQTTAIEWTVTDGAELTATDTVNVQVLASDNPLEIRLGAQTRWVNQAVTIRARFANGVEPIRWEVGNAIPPTQAPDTGQNAQFIFANDGAYCPLALQAIGANDRIGLNHELCFGIDTTGPSIELDQNFASWFNPDNPALEIEVNPENDETWPLFFAGEHLRPGFVANDEAGTTHSGLGRALIIANAGTNREQILMDEIQESSGKLPTGPLRHHFGACNTEADACTDDGLIDLAQLGLGTHTIEVRSADIAGNLTARSYHLRVSNLEQTLEELIRWTNNLKINSTLAPNLPLRRAAYHLETAQQYLTYYPGQALLHTQQVLEYLRDAADQGADTERLQKILVRAVYGQVREIIEATQAQGFTDWAPFADEAIDPEYLGRSRLLGRHNEYTVRVNDTLTLAFGLQNDSVRLYREGQYTRSIQRSREAFDALAILYDDQTLADVFQREPRLLPNRTTEGLFRKSRPQYNGGSPDLYFGKYYAETLLRQIEEITRFQEIPLEIVRQLQEITNIAEELVHTIDHVIVAGTRFFPFYQQTSILSFQILERLQRMRGLPIYTHQWEMLATYLVGDITHHIFYEIHQGPNNAYPITAEQDPLAQSLECRFDRFVRAQIDGRSLAISTDTSRQSTDLKCLTLRFLNVHHLTPLDNPIDLIAQGCPSSFDIDVNEECFCAFNPGESDLHDATCNGVDESCSGVADDEFVETNCGTGSCQSQSACLNGQYVPCVSKNSVGLPQEPICIGPQSP